jgi:aminodeoxyfutalosine deaminase
MFDTDLTREYEAARSIGIDPRAAFASGVAGALCDDETRKRLLTISETFDWAEIPEAELV